MADFDLLDEDDDWVAPRRHEISVHLQRTWGEWRPECSPCRWVGSYWPDQAQADAEADRHISGS